MRWSDEITLITQIWPDDHKDVTDDNGFTLPPLEEKQRTVFANRKSVGFSEFFKAKMAGYSEEMKFDVFTAEYDDQTIAEYNGKRYKILRAYIDPKTSGEYTELTLSDLSQRGGALDGIL